MGKLSSGPSRPRYVNLMSDAGFKAVFADRSNKEILVGLLNYALPPDVRVRDIVRYEDREQPVSVAGGKRTILDLVCVDDMGVTFSVEVQRYAERSFFERCVYYCSGKYHAGLGEGERYSSLRPVHVVAFMSFNYPHRDESLWDSDNIVSNFRMIEQRTHEFAPQTIFVNFVELDRFTKPMSECESERDCLFYWFKHGWEMDEAPGDVREVGFLRNLVDACEIASFPLSKKREYDKDMLTELDILAQRDYAREEGRAEGWTKGVAEGIASVARTMLSKGKAVSEIMEMTGLAEKDILSLDDK